MSAAPALSCTPVATSTWAVRLVALARSTSARPTSVQSSRAAATAESRSIKRGRSLSASGNLQISNYNSAFGAPAILTVTGMGSMVTVASGRTLTVGSLTASQPVLVNVLDDASLTVGAGGTTTLYPSGTLTIDGG